MDIGGVDGGASTHPTMHSHIDIVVELYRSLAPSF